MDNLPHHHGEESSRLFGHMPALEEFAASAAWVNENAEEAGALCERFGVVAKAAVAAKAIPACNIVCLTGGDMKTAASGCLQVLFDMNPAAVGGAMPGDDYYYGA